MKLQQLGLSYGHLRQKQSTQKAVILLKNAIVYVICQSCIYGRYMYIVQLVHRLSRVLHHVCLQHQSYHTYLAFTAS